MKKTIHYRVSSWFSPLLSLLSFLSFIFTLTFCSSITINAQTSVLHLIPHFHYDVAWLETEDSYGAKGADLIHQYVTKAKNEPSFKFVLDQVPLIKYFFRYYPTEVPYLQQLIAEGRCEIFGAFNVQGDEDLVIGESLVRQIFYGQKWYQENLNTYGLGAWNIDDFGHTLQMPQILARSGLQFCAFARGGDLTRKPQYSEFYWVAPDGSKALTHWMPAHYNSGKDVGTKIPATSDVQAVINNLKPSSLTGNMLSPNGDDMTAPRPYITQAIQNWNLLKNGTTLLNSTPSEFFNSVLTSGVTIPQVGPIEFQRVAMGCYSSRIDVKQRNREIEHLMLTAEKLSSMASIEGASYPKDLFDTNCADFLVNQMHDILPGSAVDAVYTDVITRFDRTESAFTGALNNAIDYLTPKINTTPASGSASNALVVFNQFNWARREAFSFDYDPATLPQPFKITDSKGAEVAYQIVANNSSSPKKILFIADVPSMAYTTYYIQKGVAPSVSPVETKTTPTNAAIETSEFLVKLLSTGEISSLTDKKSSNREWIKTATHSANQLTVRQDNGSSWDYNKGNETGSTKNYSQAVAIYKGPVAQRAVVAGAMPSAATVQRETRIYEGFHRIDFFTDFNWQGTWSYVFVSFPFNNTSVRTDGVPYGSFVRPNGEYPVTMWSDFGSSNDGITLINKGLPDHDAESDGVHVTLLRSHGGPNGNSTLHFMKGQRSFEYSLYPHTGSASSAGSAQKAWELNSPMVYKLTDIHTGSLPAQKSYVPDCGSVVMSVLTKDDYGYNMRFYNPYNSALSNVSVGINTSGITKLEETNLMGVSLNNLSASNSVSVPLKPMEIKTLRAVINSPEGSSLGIFPDSTSYLFPSQTGWLTIKALNATGNLAFSSSTTVRLTSNSSSMVFSIDKTNWAKTLDVALNMGLAKVYVSDTTTGIHTITATDINNKLSAALKSNLCIIGADHLSFIPADTLVVPVNSETPAFIECRDQRDLSYSNNSPYQVHISSDNSAIKFRTSTSLWVSEINTTLTKGLIKLWIQVTGETKGAISVTCTNNPSFKPVNLKVYVLNNLLLNKKATADGQTNDGEGPAFAVDGSLQSKWCSANEQAHWLVVDLAANTTVDYFVVKHAGSTQVTVGNPGYDDTPGMNTSSFQIQTASSSSGPWTTVINANSNPPTIRGNVSQHRLTTPVDTRFIRLLISDAGAARIYEFEAYNLGSVLNSIDSGTLLPKKYDLLQNYPNPFNPSTTIKYQLPSKSLVHLNVYNVLGKEVAKIVNKEQSAGNYAVNFNAQSLASGIYFYTIRAGSYTATGKMMLLK